jgi:hypothetical protein
MDVIKINLTICFACETKGTQLSICLVTEQWICRLWFPVPDCERPMKCSNVKCWIYSAHISFGMYDGLKSFQTTTSFQPDRVFYLVYFLVFFLRLRPKRTQPAWYKRILYELMINEILIFKIKNNYHIVFVVT